MQVLLIEDEVLAAERLSILLKQYDPSITIITVIDSVSEAIEWLTHNPHPDLLFLDIELADGKSFLIFDKINYTKPVIFTTAYNQYVLDSFKLFSIDYIIKPITTDSLRNAMDKFKTIVTPTQNPNWQALSNSIDTQINAAYKNRFLAKNGQKLYFVTEDNICYFTSENKITLLIDNQGNKFTINHTLEELESSLDPKNFFRINRQVIARYNCIDQVRPYVNGRMKVVLKNCTKDDLHIMSRERFSEFKVWGEG
jgi:two-component system, LytTR family, response regulator LytT